MHLTEFVDYLLHAITSWRDATAESRDVCGDNVRLGSAQIVAAFELGQDVRGAAVEDAESLLHDVVRLAVAHPRVVVGDDRCVPDGQNVERIQSLRVAVDERLRPIQPEALEMPLRNVVMPLRAFSPACGGRKLGLRSRRHSSVSFAA
jgi:hypothetical protein